MSILSKIVIASSILLSTVALAEQQTIDACTGISPEHSRPCLQSMVNQSEDALVRSEYNALEALVRWDEIGSISAEAQSRLRATAKTFRNYRGAECGLVRNLGRMSQDVVLENNQLACIYKLNAERIAHLSQITADLPKR